MEIVKNNTRSLCQIGIVAALYVALTLAIHPIAYGQVQLRISEVLVLLCFFNKKYGWGIVIGCFIANIFSPFPLLDMIFGTLHSLVSVLLIFKCKKLWVAGIMPVLPCFLIGFAIMLAYNLSWTAMIIITGWIMLGQFITVVGVGVPLFYWLSKNSKFMSIITS